MIESFEFSAPRLIAAFFAVLCIIFLARLLMGQRHRDRADQFFWRILNAGKSFWRGLKRWYLHRQERKSALAQAKNVINRARINSVDRHGNVIRPKAFFKNSQREQRKDEPSGPESEPRH